MLALISILAAAGAAALLGGCVQPGDAGDHTHASTPSVSGTGMAGMSMPTPMPMPISRPMSAANAAAPAADAAAATDAVAVENFAYVPATVTIKTGTTLTWTNKDQDPHTVTSMNGGPLHSAPLNAGDSYRYTFTVPGRYDYLCTIHPFMTATVVVSP